MKHLAHRCGTVGAAALAVGGMVAALTPMNQSLPDVQIRDFDLATASAANVDPGPMLDVAENHVRADLAGTGDVDSQHITLGDLLFDRGDGELGDGSSFTVGDLDQDALNELLGGSGGFDPQSLLGTAMPPLGLDFGVPTPSVAGFTGGSEQAAGSAAAGAFTGIVLAMQGLPAAQQAFNAAVIAMEQEFNSTLVAAQAAAAERLFGDNPDVNEAVNWIFALNNTVLAQHEDAFNSLFGISFDTQSSLLSHLDVDLTEADWTTLLGFSPDEFNEIVDAIQADNLSLLLGNIDWSNLFDGLF